MLTIVERAEASRRFGMARILFLLAMLLGVGYVPWWASTETLAKSDVAATVHNLAASGPGTQKDSRSAGTCAYCHTPHNAAPTQALWDRPLSGVTYQLYTSASMQVSADQPTGSSRLCLSCHDGLLALSSARLDGVTQSKTANSSPLTGPTVLGTDLRHSHPFSFTYSSALAAKAGELADPKVLPASVRLDANGQLQCTSCHDPHDDTVPKFLRMDNSNGALCMSCHRLTAWNASSHATSVATRNGTSLFPIQGHPSVAANGCNNCHASHGAKGPLLLAQASEPGNCLICHDGTVAPKNIAAEFSGSAKTSYHPIEAAQWSHSPSENTASMPRHVTCVDCHNPHQVKAASSSDSRLPGPLQGVTGVSTTGTALRSANHEYEICFKCHGESTTTGAMRIDRSRNIADKFSPSTRSYHPIVAAARNGTVRGLVQGYTASSTIGCIDCHNNSDPGPKGPHASRFAPILERNYVATDPAAESPSAYAMCYKCHDRNSIVTPVMAPTTTSGAAAAAIARTAATARMATTLPRSFATNAAGFPHWLHVVKNQTSCAVCHDAHGSRANAHLIDFMTRDKTGRKVVSANRLGQLDYITTGPGHGTCNLACHGQDHSSLGY